MYFTNGSNCSLPQKYYCAYVDRRTFLNLVTYTVLLYCIIHIENSLAVKKSAGLFKMASVKKLSSIKEGGQENAVMIWLMAKI